MWEWGLAGTHHGCITFIWHGGVGELTAAEKVAKVLVQVGEEGAEKEVKITVSGREADGVSRRQSTLGTYYCAELVPLAGLFIMRGVAPPSSRKLTALGMPPAFVEASAPEKYGRRLTPSYSPVPLARIPGTATREPGLEV